MFPLTHPDLARQLAEERIGRLRAEAESYRRAAPFLARRRSARSVAPVATPSRVVPASRGLCPAYGSATRRIATRAAKPSAFDQVA